MSSVNPLENIYRMISLSRNRQLSPYADYFDIDNIFQLHNQIVVENWYFYEGLHHLFFKRYDGEDDATFLARQENATIENHVRPILNLMVSHLYQKEDSIKRFIKKNDIVDKELMDFYKESVWEPNNLFWLDDAKALNTMVTGYSAIQRLLYDIRTDSPMDWRSSNKEKVQYGYVKKKLMDSAFCMPLPYIDSNGFCDYERLGAILYVADQDNYIGNKLIMQTMARDRRKSSHIEYIDDNVWLRFIKRDGESEYKQVPVNPRTDFQNKNPFGDIRVMFTVYRNTGDPFYIEGESEISSLKSLNMELNELGNGDKDTISYHQHPILVGENGAELPNNFVRTKNAFVGLKGKDQKLIYLTWNNDLKASDTRQESIRRVMSMVSGMGLIGRSSLRDIGQIRSGPPLKAMFTSDRATMGRKFKAFRKGEIEDMKYDIKFFEKSTGADFKIDKKVKFDAQFSEDFLGIDSLLQEEIDAIRVNKTASVEEIIRERHPDWNEQEIKIVVSEIESQIEKAQKPITKSPEKKASEQ